MTIWLILLFLLLGILGFGLTKQGDTPSQLLVPADAVQAEQNEDLAQPITRLLSKTAVVEQTEASAPLTVYRWQNEQGEWALSNTPPEDERPYQLVDYSGVEVLLDSKANQ